MLGLLITAAVLFSLACLATAIVATRPVLAARRAERMRAIKTVHVSRNHQELFLLTIDLLALHERGYMSVFPDTETLERARKLTFIYREEIGQ